jgi:hypothetical protein
MAFSESNTKFFEILPEVSLKIGNLLQNPSIVRPAFAILVSEKALSLASSDSDTPNEFAKAENGRATEKSSVIHPRATSLEVTKFYRVKEEIDNDEIVKDEYLSMIEAAAQDFQARVQSVFDELVVLPSDSQMSNTFWIDKLPEFQKLTYIGVKAEHIAEYEVVDLFALREDLRNYVRGQILGVYFRQLDFSVSEEADEHRRAEQYLNPWVKNFKNIYSALSPPEKIMTKFFWVILKELWYNPPKDTTRKSAGLRLLFDNELDFNPRNADYYWKKKIIEDHGLVEVNWYSLEAHCNRITSIGPPWSNYIPYSAAMQQMPFLNFNLDTFLHQVDDHVYNVCARMLSHDSGSQPISFFHLHFHFILL